jgi:Domain of unknown function (DUF4169)
MIHTSCHVLGVFGYEASYSQLPHRAVHAMGDIISFRKARKQAGREAAARKAAAQRLQHGRSKVARELEAAQAAKRRRDLDRHRIEPGDER